MCPVVSFFGDAVNRLNHVLHVLEGRGVGADGVCWHSTATGCQHAKGYFDAVIAGRGVIVESGQVMFERSAEVRGEFGKHDWIHRCASWDRSMLAII